MQSSTAIYFPVILRKGRRKIEQEPFWDSRLPILNARHLFICHFKYLTSCDIPLSSICTAVEPYLVLITRRFLLFLSSIHLVSQYCQAHTGQAVQAVINNTFIM